MHTPKMSTVGIHCTLIEIKNGTGYARMCSLKSYNHSWPFNWFGEMTTDKMTGSVIKHHGTFWLQC